MSMTISSLVVLVASWIGLEITEEEALKVLMAISVLGVWYGRWRRGDITWWGGRQASTEGR